MKGGARGVGSGAKGPESQAPPHLLRTPEQVADPSLGGNRIV